MRSCPFWLRFFERVRSVLPRSSCRFVLAFPHRFGFGSLFPDPLPGESSLLFWIPAPGLHRDRFHAAGRTPSQQAAANEAHRDSNGDPEEVHDFFCWNTGFTPLPGHAPGHAWSRGRVDFSDNRLIVRLENKGSASGCCEKNRIVRRQGERVWKLSIGLKRQVRRRAGM